jgi:hypothetical protein
MSNIKSISVHADGFSVLFKELGISLNKSKSKSWISFSYSSSSSNSFTLSSVSITSGEEEITLFKPLGLLRTA